MYEVIVEVVPGEDERFFLWWKLWWMAVPSKIVAFSWKTVCERFKCGIFDGLGACICSMCLSPTESSNHVLFSCPMALLVWQAISLWLDKLMLYSSSAREHFVEFVQSENSNDNRKVTGLI